MADINAQQLAGMLADAYAILKDHQHSLRELMAEAEGMKATMTGPDRIAFDRAKKRSLDESEKSSNENSEKFAAIIGELRGR